MLILQRRKREQIYFDLPDGRRITITCLGKKNGQHRFGIDAPKDVAVLRPEHERTSNG